MKNNQNPNQILCDNILEILGTPPGFLKCIARNVSDSRFRVNVYIKVKSNTSLIENEEISDSFFVTVDKNMAIKNSNPEIKRKYITATITVTES